MTEFLFQAGFSNALFSLLLAITALAAGLVIRRPQLVYLMWLLVFIKLLTPPVMSVPVAPALWQPAQGSTAQIQLEEFSLGNSDLAAVKQPADQTYLVGHGTEASQMTNRAVNWLATAKTWLPLALLLGSLLAFSWSVVHILSFHRRLTADAKPAPPEIQTATAAAAQQLNLPRVPRVCTTSAHMSPLVWWLGGQLAIIVPAQLLEQLDCQQRQLVLAHELAHIRRRDYIVRWLEWLACLSFWWNPVVWWAQRNLRATEEMCCDALVLSSLKPQPRIYARSLLTVVEFLAYPALRAPALASEISSGGLFLRRCRMIVSENANRATARWMRALVILFAILVLPLGAHLYAKDKAETEPAKAATVKSDKAIDGTHKQTQDEYLKSVWAGLQDKVEAGQLSEGEADARFEELKMALHLDSCKQASIKAELSAAKAKLDAELAAGSITKQEADLKQAEIEQSIKEQQFRQQETYQALVKDWDKLETLINEGMATFEEAVTEYEHAKQQILTEGDPYAGASKHYQEAVAEFQAAIRVGKLTHAEAFTKLSAVEMAIFAKVFKKAEMQHLGEATWANLQAAVARGEITQEEAEAKLIAYEHDLQAKGEQKTVKQDKPASEEKQAVQEKKAKEQKKKQVEKKQDSKD